MRNEISARTSQTHMRIPQSVDDDANTLVVRYRSHDSTFNRVYISYPFVNERLNISLCFWPGQYEFIYKKRIFLA